MTAREPGEARDFLLTRRHAPPSWPYARFLSFLPHQKVTKLIFSVKSVIVFSLP